MSSPDEWCPEDIILFVGGMVFGVTVALIVLRWLDLHPPAPASVEVVPTPADISALLREARLILDHVNDGGGEIAAG